MTAYLLKDVDKFEDYENSTLEKDEYGLANLGIVRVDDKYSRNYDFTSWQESIEEAFKEYNGNASFTQKGYTSELSNSWATIHVYSGNTLIKTFSVPNIKKGNVWKVFEITNSGIKSVNKFYNCSDPSEVKYYE